MHKTIHYTFKSAHVAYFAGVASGLHEISSAGALVILVILGIAAMFRIPVEG